MKRRSGSSCTPECSQHDLVHFIQEQSQRWISIPEPIQSHQQVPYHPLRGCKRCSWRYGVDILTQPPMLLHLQTKR